MGSFPGILGRLQGYLWDPSPGSLRYFRLSMGSFPGILGRLPGYLWDPFRGSPGDFQTIYGILPGGDPRETSRLFLFFQGTLESSRRFSGDFQAIFAIFQGSLARAFPRILGAFQAIFGIIHGRHWDSPKGSSGAFSQRYFKGIFGIFALYSLEPSGPPLRFSWGILGILPGFL
jgi:hypothetical protein